VDGAIDAGLPVRLVTPFENIQMVNKDTGLLTVTWQEMLQVLSRGGQLTGG